MSPTFMEQIPYRATSWRTGLFLAGHRPGAPGSRLSWNKFLTEQRVRIRRFHFGAVATLSCCTRGDGTSSNAPKRKPRMRTLSHNPALFLSRHRLVERVRDSHGTTCQLVEWIDIHCGEEAFLHSGSELAYGASSKNRPRKPVAGRRHLPKRCFGSGCARPVATLARRRTGAPAARTGEHMSFGLMTVGPDGMPPITPRRPSGT